MIFSVCNGSIGVKMAGDRHRLMDILSNKLFINLNADPQSIGDIDSPLEWA